MESLLVSACLLGVCCRYDGANCKNDAVIALKSRYHLVPICPECLGGLTTPRAPSERIGAAVVSHTGTDVTGQFLRGAQQAVYLAELLGCRKALLKAHSPSCGKGPIYDGSFSGRLVPGMGAAAELLQQAGIALFDETEAATLAAAAEV